MWSKARHPSLLNDVRYLIHRRHAPLVEVRPSFLPNNAGNGIFVKRPIEKGRVVCLYPGIYTPGLPKYAAESEDSVYLGDSSSPSGRLIEENEYLLNLNALGGYIDGAALVGIDRTSLNERRLDDNPSACGNLINHSSSESNVEMLPFYWGEVEEQMDRLSRDVMPFPNQLRSDGSTWYLDGLTEKVVSFPSLQDDCRDVDPPLLCGAAFCSLKDLDVGTELLLDYKLKGPYPAWAEEWYE